MSLTKVTFSMIDGPIVYVKDFGAVGDGVIDDTNAIQEALDAGANIVFEPQKNYKITSDLSKVGDVNIIGNNATLTFTESRLTLGGTLGSYVALSNDIANRSSSFTLSSLSVQENDLIKVFEDVDFSWSFNDATARKGDIFEIQSIVGTTVFIRGISNNSYTAANGKVAKITYAKVQMSDLTLIGDEVENLVLSVQYSRDSMLQRVRVNGGEFRALFLQSNYRILVEDCEAINRAPAASANYGISLSENKYVTVSGGYFYGTRHGVHIGSSGTGVSRETLISRATIQNDPTNVVEVYAADIHSTAFNTIYEKCEIIGAAALAGFNATYTGNNIYALQGVDDYPLLNIANIVAGEFIVENNTFYTNLTGSQFAVIKPSASSNLEDYANDYSVVFNNNTFYTNNDVRYIFQMGLNEDNPRGVRASFIVNGVITPRLDLATNFEGVFYYNQYGTFVSTTLNPYSLVVKNVYSLLELPATARVLRIADLPANVQNFTNIELPEFLFKQAFAVGAGAYQREVTVTLPCSLSNRTNAVKLSSNADKNAFDGAATMWADAVLTDEYTAVFRVTTGNTGETVTTGGTFNATYVVGG